MKDLEINGLSYKELLDIYKQVNEFISFLNKEKETVETEPETNEQ